MDDDAEDDGEDAADEHGEEVVDARAAAAQAVDALELEGERRQHRDERQHVAGTARAADSPRVTGMRPLSNRMPYARTNAHIASSASVTT